MKGKKPPSRPPGLFRPSAAHRWLKCPGSEMFIRHLVETGRIPVHTDTEHSVLGTAKHEAVEMMMRFRELGEMKPTHKPFVKMVKGLKLQDKADEIWQDAHDALYALIEADVVTDFKKVVTELKLNPTVLMRGKIDVAVEHGPKSRFPYTIVDWKFGYRKVDPIRNPQQMMYAILLLGMDVRPVRIVIVQKDDDEKWQVKQWVAPAKELKEFRDRLKSAIETSMAMHWTSKGMLVPGNAQCQWCDARPFCPAIAGKAAHTAMVDVNAIPEGLTLEDAYRSAKTCATLVSSIESYVLSLDEAPKGFKIVQGRDGNRRWSDRAAVETKLKGAEGAWETKLLTPTQMEKKDPTSYKKVVTLVERPPGNRKVELEGSSSRELAFKDLDLLQHEEKGNGSKEK